MSISINPKVFSVLKFVSQPKGRVVPNWIVDGLLQLFFLVFEGLPFYFAVGSWGKLVELFKGLNFSHLNLSCPFCEVQCLDVILYCFSSEAFNFLFNFYFVFKSLRLHSRLSNSLCILRDVTWNLCVWPSNRFFPGAGILSKIVGWIMGSLFVSFHQLSLETDFVIFDFIVR